MAESLALPGTALPGTAPTAATPPASAGRRPRARRRALRPVLAAVRFGASAALLAAVVVIAVATVVVPRLAGWTPLTVLTDSMSPGLPPGTLVVVQPVDPADLAVGDVVTYQLRSGDPTLVTHRIVGVSATPDGVSAYVLQGDNNPTPDIDPVLPQQVQGRVAYAVPLLGHVNTALSGAGRGGLVLATAAVLFAYAAYSIGGALVTRMRGGRESGEAGRRTSAD